MTDAQTQTITGSRPVNPALSLQSREAQLAQGLKEGSEEALKKTMQLYKTPVYRYLLLLVKNRETAEELAQDTFVKAFFKGKSLRSNHLKPWLFKIATNLARSEWRRNRFKRHLHLSIEDYPDHWRVEPSCEEEIVTRETIDAIPGRYRVPFVLKVIQDFSYEDISAVLNKPPGTVKSLVHRAKSKIRRQYAIEKRQ